MKFYKELSRVYDIVFPKDNNTLKFLCKDLKVNSKILDLACGTGTYSIALAQKGHRVDAVDLDEDMIELAKGKGGLFADFIVADMARVKEIFPNEKYDLVYCIGNSIVHLKNKERIEKFIKDIYDMLSEEGALIVQIVSYDRVIDNNINELPTIEREDKGVKFTRNYNYKEEEQKVEFNTELLITKGDKTENFKNSVDLVALRKEELLNMFEKCGFKDISVYGNFSEEEFTNDSFALILRGIKK